jgi:hypothetical protein
MPFHVVNQGECMSSIAALHGFDWKTLWNHSENMDLKSERKNPNVLYPDDQVFIPDKTLKEDSAATEKKHKYKRKGVPAMLKIRLLNNGQPRKNIAWKANLGGKWQEGTSDGDGQLQIKLDPRCDAGILRLEDGTEYRLMLRELDPLDTTSGVQARLNNLGYESGPLDGKPGPLTTDAIKRFQADYPPLKVDGIVGDETKAKLKEIYGC